MNIAFVTYSTKYNKYSFNALIGALETVDHLAGLPVYFYHQREALCSGLKDILQKYDQIILGLSFSTPQLWEIADLVGHVRDQYHHEHVLLIAGGPHPTGNPPDTLKLGFDLVVIGEGEETLICLLEKILKDESTPILGSIALRVETSNGMGSN